MTPTPPLSTAVADLDLLPLPESEYWWDDRTFFWRDSEPLEAMDLYPADQVRSIVIKAVAESRAAPASDIAAAPEQQQDQAMVDLMPKRAAFLKWAKDRALDVTEDKDAWGKRKFMHSHVQALWDSWFNAPATYAQPAPAEVSPPIDYAMGYAESTQRLGAPSINHPPRMYGSQHDRFPMPSMLTMMNEVSPPDGAMPEPTHASWECMSQCPEHRATPEVAAPERSDTPAITDENAKGYRPPCCDGGAEGSACCSEGVCVADLELAEMGIATPTAASKALDAAAPAGLRPEIILATARHIEDGKRAEFEQQFKVDLWAVKSWLENNGFAPLRIDGDKQGAPSDPYKAVFGISGDKQGAQGDA